MGRQEQETAMYDQPDILSHLNDDQRQMAREMAEDPRRLSSVLQDEIGVDGVAGPDVKGQALDIINELGEDLVLNMRQWQIVQNMIEAGIVAGWESLDGL